MQTDRVGDATLYTGDVLDVLATLPEESVHCVVTSPPYYALRDYGVPGQIGLEETPEQYIAKMVEVFRAVRRVLRDDGTLWLNIGDSYAGSGRGPSGSNGFQNAEQRQGFTGGTDPRGPRRNKTDAPEGYKAKDLIGIPWMLAFALRADGWYLRSDIIWAKPNPMPESVTDRPTKAHEYLFLLSKSARYFYDAEAIREDGTTTRPELLAFGDRPDVDYPGHADRRRSKKPDGWDTGAGGHGNHHRDGREHGEASEIRYGRNRRTVWTIATEPYPEAHFATFPRKLVQPCILAGCPVGGTVLDPFGGSGTTAEVALEYGRRAILVELKPEYVELQKKRLEPVAGRPLLNFA